MIIVLLKSLGEKNIIFLEIKKKIAITYLKIEKESLLHFIVIQIKKQVF